MRFSCWFLNPLVYPRLRPKSILGNTKSTMHMFAIDGLRIALIAGMLVAILRALQISRAWCGVIAIPAIWFYTAATGWEPSAVRASVMMTVVLGGWSLKRPGDLLNSLAAAAFLILEWDPRQLFEA